MIIEDLDDEFSVKIAIEDRSNPLSTPVSLAELFENQSYKMIRLDILRDLTMLSEYFPQLNQLIASSDTGLSPRAPSKKKSTNDCRIKKSLLISPLPAEKPGLAICRMRI